MTLRHIIFIAVACVVTSVSAARNEEVKPSILKDITRDSINIVIQSNQLAALLDFSPVKKAEVKKPTNVGYRVQVFSDSNANTAKNEVRNRQRNVASRFPQYPTYVSFSSPYWRLKIGDFADQDAANNAANALRRAFPSYARDVRVVRDRINVHKD